MNERKTKPAIPIFKAQGADEKRLSEICCGLEEEGLPFSISALPVPPDCPAHTGLRELAASSPFGICILLYCDRAELYDHRITSGPLFQVAPDKGERENKENPCRRLGKNAARLVKGRPFEIDE